VTVVPPKAEAIGLDSQPDEAVRRPAMARPTRPGGLAATPRRIVAIGGGKGGIGKSLLSVALANELVGRGLRVVLVDCDLGGPNLHSLLAMPFPRETLSDFILHRANSLAELAVPTPVPGLSLISGARNAVQVANPMHQQKVRLMKAVRTLPADVVLLDLGAGSHYNIVDFFLLAHHGVLVVVPEPTSVENAYRFLKAAFLRKVKNAELGEDIKELLQAAAQERDGRAATPVDLVASLCRRAPEVGARIQQELSTFHPSLIVNRARDPGDLALGEGMCAAAGKLFGLDLRLLGLVHHSMAVERAVRLRLPLLFEHLGREFASEIAVLTTGLLALPAPAEDDG
jgi:flagellar biosynthesis protein FlhG